jgi:hypothetical protein
MFVQLTKAFLGKPAGERFDLPEEDAKSLIAQQLAVPVTDDLITPAVSKALESKNGHRGTPMNTDKSLISYLCSSAFLCG